MPSPFPGMDPWLEHHTVWPGFHDILIVKTVEILQPQLRQMGYYANVGERVWLTEPRRPIYTDVVAIQRTSGSSSLSEEPVAVLEADEPVRVRHMEVEIREPFVEVYDAAGNRLVSGVEYLSPTNKSDADGCRLYLQKQDEMRQAGVHLVEVDWLRQGPHVLDVPAEVVEDLRPWDYLVNIVRQGSDEYEIYPIPLRQRLPRIKVPLSAGDKDAVLDLQDVFNKSYDVGPYPERLNYAAQPSPPLSEEDEVWADHILQEKGIRK